MRSEMVLTFKMYEAAFIMWIFSSLVAHFSCHTLQPKELLIWQKGETYWCLMCGCHMLSIWQNLKKKLFKKIMKLIW